jgi:hypothetical protein
MTDELRRATLRMDDRKRARFGEPDEKGRIGGGGVHDEGDEGATLLSGTDLDPIEVKTYCARARQIADTAATDGADLRDLAAAMWLEGIVLGLLIAEGRGS